MHLVFDIFQGIGVAAALGIRPFLPALLVGALAAGDVEIHFKSTNLAFLQSGWFLLLLVLLAIALAVAERRIGHDRVDARPTWITIGLIGAVLGALFFAGSLARGHYTEAPGFVAGVICAVVGLAATRPLFARVRARLDPAAASAVPLYAEGLAVLLAGLSVIAPPVGLIGLALLLWLIVAGRRRGNQKYAGLRILR